MSSLREHRSCASHCNAPVPKELESVGLCVSHFTFNVEKACAEMHRQLAMGGISAERKSEIVMYLGECSTLLATVASGLSLSDQLKRRVLSTFLSLMNLRETLERSEGLGASPLRVARAAAVAATA
jgi:hypothetical protein